MVPLAYGTQTAGSVIRPASFCGVAGFKPAHGWRSTDGIKRLSARLDTLGTFGRTRRRRGAAGRLSTRRAPREPRIAFCRTPWWDRLEDGGRAAVEDGRPAGSARRARAAAEFAGARRARRRP